MVHFLVQFCLHSLGNQANLAILNTSFVLLSEPTFRMCSPSPSGYPPKINLTFFPMVQVYSGLLIRVCI